MSTMSAAEKLTPKAEMDTLEIAPSGYAVRFRVCCRPTLVSTSNDPANGVAGPLPFLVGIAKLPRKVHLKELRLSLCPPQRPRASKASNAGGKTLHPKRGHRHSIDSPDQPCGKEIGGGSSPNLIYDYRRRL